jgi:hypothetical protein
MASSAQTRVMLDREEIAQLAEKGRRAKGGVREAFGPCVQPGEDKTKQTPEQQALRLLVAGEDVGHGGATAGALEAAAGVLAAEWESGKMPSSRRAFTVRAALRSDASSVKGRRHAELLSDLAAKIATAPQGEGAHSPRWSWLSCDGWRMTPKRQTSSFKGELACMHEFGSQTEECLAVLLSEAWDGATAQKIRAAGGLPPGSLGSDPARALMEAVLDVGELAAPTGQGGRAGRLVRALDHFGVRQARGLTNRPLLLVAIWAYGMSGGDAPGWLETLARADQEPWLRFDHQAAAWRGEHPLWALARVSGRNGCHPLFEKAVRAVAAMGYGGDGSFPPGLPSELSQEAQEARAEAPSPVWAAVLADGHGANTAAAIAALAQAGADWRMKGGDGPSAAPVLAALNERAKKAHWGSGPFQPQENPWHESFARLVALGADPLDALPPPTALDAAEGKIRDLVSHGLERRALEESVSEAELREALALLREKKAQDRERAAAAGDKPRGGPRL